MVRTYATLTTDRYLKNCNKNQPLLAVFCPGYRGPWKPVEERTLPLIVDNTFFSMKEGSRTEMGFTAICCQCKKDFSVQWGVNSNLLRHLNTGGHEGLLDRYEATKQLANVLPTELRNRGQRKPIEKRTLPLLVDNTFFYLKDGSQTEKGFTAVCCQCHKDTSVSWGVSSPLVRHLKTKGHEDILAKYEAAKQQEEEERGVEGNFAKRRRGTYSFQGCKKLCV